MPTGKEREGEGGCIKTARPRKYYFETECPENKQTVGLKQA